MDPLLTVSVVGLGLISAGVAKGTLGIGLPPIAMGLMVLVMPPVEAAALLVIPAFASNIWQMMAGGFPWGLIRRLWPLLLCSATVTIAGAGWLGGGNAGVATIILGMILALYAALNLTKIDVRIAHQHEGWSGAAAGLTTGLATAATGIAAVPAVPYLQAIGLERDALIQAMGLSFSVSMLALLINLGSTGDVTWDQWPQILLACAAVFLGLGLGQALRKRLDPSRFKRLFLWGLLVLGLFLAARAALSL